MKKIYFILLIVSSLAVFSSCNKECTVPTVDIWDQPFAVANKFEVQTAIVELPDYTIEEKEIIITYMYGPDEKPFVLHTVRDYFGYACAVTVDYKGK